MHSRRLPVREFVGLALLGFAVVIALPIVFGSDTSAPGPAATPTPVFDTPTPAGPIEPTPTPIPDRGQLPKPRSWVMVFAKELAGGARQEETPSTIETLDLRFEGAPFGDYRDGAWSLTALTSVDGLEPGRYTFTLDYDCEIRVNVNGEELAKAPDPPGVRQLKLSFVTLDGRAGISIEAKDGPGPLILRMR
jgi:hypothetical protein